MCCCCCCCCVWRGWRGCGGGGLLDGVAELESSSLGAVVLEVEVGDMAGEVTVSGDATLRDSSSHVTSPSV